ncbi:MAG: DEAD/DEAH box helicase [Acidimicrobiales bacterium]
MTEAFTLDPFQQQAVAAIDRGESVLVAAPTGAGKTVVAEHAVERVLAEPDGRVFYTTPVKALSNQKYGDLVRRHGPDRIGLLTGDNSINGDARVVVMTTEVLRNMIYAGRPLDDLRFVVLDEVHYLQDAYRGPVWEEVIIHVPVHVRLVCLSATVSNADELAAWLTEVRGPTATVIEHHRPVELEHLYAVADGVEDTLRVIPTLVGDRPNPEGPEFDSQRIRGRGGPGGRRRHRWFTPDRSDLVDRLGEEDLLPAIFFVFSRAGCDDAARQVARSGPALTTAVERARIDQIVDEHVSELTDRDLTALQFGVWRDGLQVGVAAHHAGMVPPFKEAVEACFVEGLVKVVFATETLALGINMPARSVVISSLSKFTGERHERLTPSQYTQLTGRAGRRGIDDHGTAVVLWSPYVGFSDVAALAASRRFELRSAFRPTYNMAANLVRRHDPETAHRLLSLSFAQFQSDRALVRAERGIDGRRRELEEVEATATCDRGDVDEYLALLDAGRVAQAQAPQRVIEEALSGLSPGDVVDAPMKDGHERVAVLSVAHRAQGHVRVRAVSRTGKVLTFGAQTVTAAPVVLGALELPEPYRPNNQKFRNEVARRLDRTRTRRPSPSTREVVAPDDHPVAGCPDLRKHLRSARRARRLRQEIAAHEKRLGQETGSLAREFDRVLQVLDGRGILDGWALTESGLRLARLYHECDLLVAETIGDGLLDGLDGPDLVALLSCFTYEHRSPEPAPAPTFPNVALRDRWEQLADLATDLLKEEAALSLRLTREPDPGFIPLAYEWTKGDQLDEVLGDDELSGGDFVRQIRQLLDLLRQIAEVAPDPTTRDTARAAIRRVDRGVVAASSSVSVT